MSHRHSRRRSARRRRAHSHQGSDVSVITDARRSPLDDWRHRKRVYAGLQLARIPLLVAAVVSYAWLDSAVLAAVFAVVSLPLPWVAVLLANEKNDDREKGEPKVYKPGLARKYRLANEGHGVTARSFEQLTSSSANDRMIIDSEPNDTEEEDDNHDGTTDDR